MIGFEDVNLTYEQACKTDTLFLTPNAIQLQEVIINSFNLKEAINHVLVNYSKLYVDEPFEKECNFKESFIVDNSHKRLVVAKVNWWDKSYEIKKTELKLRLASIQCNKNSPLDIFVDVPNLNKPSNSGSMDLISIRNTIYLNLLLKSVMHFNLTSYVEKTTDNVRVVHFESDWNKVGKSIFQQLIGTITFDKKTKAILNMSYEVNNKNNIKKSILKENNKETTTETTNSSMKFNFQKSLNNKLSLKSYEAAVYLDVSYDNKIHKIISENKIYVLKETAIKKVSNDGLIDLTKPIFKSLPATTISSTNSILLSEKELKFINGKN